MNCNRSAILKVPNFYENELTLQANLYLALFTSQSYSYIVYSAAH